MVFSSGEGLRRVLFRGLGLCLCPEIAVRKDLEAGRLTRLNWPPAPAETMILMIRNVDKWRSPLLARFMEVACQVISGL